MSWILIIILIGKMAGSTNSLLAIEFATQIACEEAAATLLEQDTRWERQYPTDTPYCHVLCVPKGDEKLVEVNTDRKSSSK